MKVINQSSFDRWPFEDNSIQSIITSPPYYSLREYCIPDIIIGGNSECEHEFIEQSYVRNNDKTASEKQKSCQGSVGRDEPIKHGFCLHCNAWRGQYGLEPTFQLYIEHTLLWCQEAKRVLRDNGIMFLNLGDSYSGSGGAGGDYGNGGLREGQPKYKQSSTILPPKCLLDIPFRVSIALVDNQGWIKRNNIPWYSPNKMPESVTDRFSKKHEMIFMMVKPKERKGWKNVKIYEATDVELSWLAAMIDGEGTISIGKFKADTNFGERPRYQSGVVVNNSCRAIIDKCMAITGIGNIGEMEGTNKKVYRWQANGIMAEAVLKAVYPHLIAKQEQAKVALNLQSTNIRRGNNKGNNRGPALITDEEIAVKESFYILCKQLNQGEVERSNLSHPDITLPERYMGCNDYYFDLDGVKEPSSNAGKSIVLGEKSFSKGSSLGADVKMSGNSLKDIYEVPISKNPGDIFIFNTQPSPEKHYAMWPESLVERMIKCSTKPGDIVLDPFMGSGTTLRVADKLNREAYGIDLGYQDIQGRRLSNIQKELVYP